MDSKLPILVAGVSGLLVGGVSVHLLASSCKGGKKASADAKSGDFLFYSADFCPFAHRVWLTLLEKKIKYQRKEVDLSHKAKDFLEVSPSGTVPAFVHGGKHYYESLIACEYLEDAFPDSGNSILPTCADERFRIRYFVSTVAKKIESNYYTLLMNLDEKVQNQAKKDLEAAFKDCNKQIQKSGGPYLFGEKFTFADIACYPFIERLVACCGHYRAWTLPEGEGFEKLQKWVDAMEARDSIKITRRPRQEDSASWKAHFLYNAKNRKEYLIQVYENYSKGSAELAKKKKEAEEAVPYFESWDLEYP